MGRNYRRSLEQIYALEGWRGVAKAVPEIGNRKTEAAQRSAAYRVVRGLKDRKTGERLPRQELSKAGQKAINRSAGQKFSTRQTTSKTTGRSTTIGAKSRGQLAVAKLNERRRIERDKTKANLERGAISQKLADRQMRNFQPLSQSYREQLLRAAEEGRWEDFREGEYDEDGVRRGGYKSDEG